MFDVLEEGHIAKVCANERIMPIRLIARARTFISGGQSVWVWAEWTLRHAKYPRMR